MIKLIFLIILTFSVNSFAVEIIDENEDPTVNDAKRALIHSEKNADEIICEEGDACVTQKNKAKEDAAKEYISEKKSMNKKSNKSQIEK